MSSSCIRAEQLEDLDAAAQITPEDIATADEFARCFFSPLMLAMLNATVEPGLSEVDRPI